MFSIADSVIGVHGYKQALDFIKYESVYIDPEEKNMFNQVMMSYLSSYNGDIKAAQKYEAQLSPKKQLKNYSLSENLVIEPAKSISASQ